MVTPLKPPSQETEEASAQEPSGQVPPGGQPSTSGTRRAVTWLCLVAGPALVAISYFPIIRASLSQDPWLMTIFEKHYAAIFGLPGAALLSFILVVVFEARFDRIEMEVASVLKFKGASGPVILWVLCFLSIAAAIKMLW